MAVFADYTCPNGAGAADAADVSIRQYDVLAPTTDPTFALPIHLAFLKAATSHVSSIARRFRSLAWRDVSTTGVLLFWILGERNYFGINIGHFLPISRSCFRREQPAAVASLPRQSVAASGFCRNSFPGHYIYVRMPSDGQSTHLYFTIFHLCFSQETD